MLKVSGIFVAPAEIENCLLQHEAVLECAVVGHDAGDGLVKPKAFVVLREKVRTEPTESGVAADVGCDDGSQTRLDSELVEELKEFVKSHLAVYKYPRWIEFIDSMPKNDRGKIDRKQLKARDS